MLFSMFGHEVFVGRVSVGDKDWWWFYRDVDGSLEANARGIRVVICRLNGRKVTV